MTRTTILLFLFGIFLGACIGQTIIIFQNTSTPKVEWRDSVYKTPVLQQGYER
mgnify:CR=1 FL=1